MRKLSIFLGLLLLVGGSSLAYAADGPATVKVVTNSAAGNILADENGRTLYLFTRDERNKSNCSGSCAALWPPLMTTGDPKAIEGASSRNLGTITRDDGAKQVTYDGWPLYYFSRDEKAGDVKGQNFGGIWFVVAPEGGPRMTNAKVNLATNPGLGSFLVDSSGRSLYMFEADEFNKSSCYDRCAEVWPPLLTIGTARAGEGVSNQLLSFARRRDGSSQVTYKGWPLYYFAPDEKPGDVRGQNVRAFGALWLVVSPAGDLVRGAPIAAAATTTPAATTPAASSAPAALPRTGGAPVPVSEALAALGFAALASGLLLKRKTA